MKIYNTVTVQQYCSLHVIQIQYLVDRPGAILFLCNHLQPLFKKQQDWCFRVAECTPPLSFVSLHAKKNISINHHHIIEAFFFFNSC